MKALKITRSVLRIIIWLLLFIPVCCLLGLRWLIFRARFLREAKSSGIDRKCACSMIKEFSPLSLTRLCG